MMVLLDAPVETTSRFSISPRVTLTLILLAALLLLPLYTVFTGNTFVVTLFTRVLILAIAAVSAMRGDIEKREAVSTGASSDTVIGSPPGTSLPAG